MNNYISISPTETEFLIDLFLALVYGVIIGIEIERKNKPAGIGTQTLVIGASMLFSFLSKNIGISDPTRIAARLSLESGFSELE